MIKRKAIHLMIFVSMLVLIFFWNNLQVIEAKQKQSNKKTIEKRSYNLGVIGAFSEVVSLGIKKLALSAALSPEEMEDLISDAQQIAGKNGVKIYLEKDFLTTDLFPDNITREKYVLLIYLNPVKDQYMALKKEKEILIKTKKYHGEARREVARKMGRLLSYPETKIEELLAKKRHIP